MQNGEALVERAIDLFNKGFNCAQASFAALCEHWGLEGSPRVASCFGGGIGRTGAACGILTGSLMALGLLAGTDDPLDVPTKEKVTKLGREYITKFNALKGTVNCKDLLGFDISGPGGHEELGRRGLKKSVCIPVMESAMVLMDTFAREEGLLKS